MILNIENAPSSPETTRSSYLYNGRVVNHNIQVIFSNVDYGKWAKHPSNKENQHVVNIQSIDPNNTDEEVLKSIKLLIQTDSTAIEKPKYAFVFHQIVGKENDQFHDEHEMFKIDW